MASLLLIACGLVAMQATRTAASASRLQSVLGSLESRFAVSHTWVEELEGGDRNVDVRSDILANQAEAARRCARLLDGSRRLGDARFGERAGSLCRGIATFRRMTAIRLADPRSEPENQSAQHRDDVVFTAVMADADAARTRLERVAAAQRDRRGLALVAAILLLLAVVLASWRLARRARRSSPAAELAELRTIKQALVPSAIPERPGLELATCHVPAEAGVAGDFHLVAAGPRGTTAIFVGDVAGKGVLAARRAAYLRASLAAFAPYEDSPRRLLELGNRALMHAAGVSEHFVTLACVVVDPSNGALTWASAGHPPPVRLDTGSALEAGPSLPLGLSSELRLEEQTLELELGDGLLLYTDGLTEARPGGVETLDLLGPERVGRLVREHAGDDPRELTDALRALAEQHSGGRLADDLCLVALRLARVGAAVS